MAHNIKPGDHVSVSTPYPYIQHDGVVVPGKNGGLDVIQFSDREASRFDLNRTTFDDFAGNGKVRVVQDRTVSREQAVKNAERMERNGKGTYNMIMNNCQDAATAAVQGSDGHSRQREQLTRVAALSTGPMAPMTYVGMRMMQAGAKKFFGG